MGLPLSLIPYLCAALAQAQTTIGAADPGKHTTGQAEVTIYIANIEKYGKEQGARLILHEGMHLVYIRRMEQVQAAIHETAAERPSLLAHRDRYSDPRLDRFAPAFRLLIDGKPQEAIEAIHLQMNRSIVKPQDGTVYAMLGTAYWKAGDSAAAVDAFTTAISYDPSLEKPWSALEALTPRTSEYRLPRSVDGRPELLPVLTCSNPATWPRFAVLGCAAAYVRYADRLEGDGSTSTAARIRDVAVDALLDHARSAISSHAYDAADDFIALAVSIHPLPSLYRRQQETAYWLLSLLCTIQHRYLQAMDAYEHLADLGRLDRKERRLLGWLVYETGISVSWDPETHILRSADRDDFFDSPFHKHRGNIPYGMTSPDEDFATYTEVIYYDASQHTNRFDETIRKRLSEKNFELPVKKLLESLWGQLSPSAGEKEDYHPDWFVGDIHDIDDAMRHAENVAEPTLIALEVAKRTLAILDRMPRD